ncbi:MAG: hypothetical protein LJE70_09725 [Chromatiaceae bacterium]|jgi:hypothetical protein|nr:hypothetical protein [Chromatiaceae bacterium]
MVPSACWAKVEASLFRNWSDDVYDSFRFYLADPDPQTSAGSLYRARSILCAKLAGLVLEEEAPGPMDGQVNCYRLVREPAGNPGANCLPAWRVPPALIGDLRAARALLEALAARSPGGCGLLILGGEDVDIRDLRRWWDLARLMGVAA